MRNIENYEEFTELIKQEIMVVIAKTKTCVVCKPISAKLENFMVDYQSIPVYEIYLEDMKMFQGQHLVFTVPTIIFFSNSREIMRESRFVEFEKFERLFNIYLQ